MHVRRCYQGYLLAPLAFVAGLIPAIADEALTLQLPVNCAVGRDCFIQNFVDREEGPESVDYMCGNLTYDGHKGTDFRILDTPTATSTEVLAAARGRVLRVRDGMNDISFRESSTESVAGRECGNAVVIDHGRGWQTQYCHLARGSVAVRPGDRVESGQVIGKIGLSGLTEFPHLHFSVSRDGAVIDPFSASQADGECGKSDFLWDPRWEEDLLYLPTFVINKGFVSSSSALKHIDDGVLGEFAFVDNLPVLMAVVRIGGLQKGDVQEFTLYAPDGEKLAAKTTEPSPSQYATYLMVIGKKRPGIGWQSGSYRAVYRVLRNGVEVASATFSTTS